jgi:hypothetical protein
MKEFSSAQFVRTLARRLVAEFEDAAVAGTPGLIGSAKEHPARKQLEKLLPPTAAVGSGIVMDSYNGRSKQQDIVLFERAFTPIFSINDTSEATYFPIEGVIATGEVKSSLNRETLHDSIEKIRSVRRLRRHATAEDHGLGPIVPPRIYGSPLPIGSTKAEEFSPSTRRLDRTFGFVLAGRLDANIETVLAHLAAAYRDDVDRSAPQIIVVLGVGFFQRIGQDGLMSDAEGSTDVVFSPSEDGGFLNLLTMLAQFVRDGRTVSLKHYVRYLMDDPSTLPRYPITHRVSL